LISIPAGIVRMPFGSFSIMTVAGAAIWCTVLAYLGKQIIGGDPQLIHDPAMLVHFIKHKSLLVAGIVAVLCALYFLVIWLTTPKEEKAV
jgi:membrane protein DedA with SNARE-associated domain